VLRLPPSVLSSLAISIIDGGSMSTGHPAGEWRVECRVIVVATSCLISGKVE